ncbi:MAG: SDR family oxidoreductase [Actinobacteria bacterium]|nr:MAG: SDR family oxidoreductase [Actinomycetota bacterium]
MPDGLSVLTGFPGFIGRRLVARLLEDPQRRVVALVEPRMQAAADQAVAELGAGERVEVLGADITDRRLGLDDDAYERLRAEASVVFHLAAIYDLAVPLEVAQRVNVDGTGNVLDFCASAERLERLNYVSTAYVAGLRRGVVYEHELALGQAFKNNYESTKFQAEVWVRAAMDRVPSVIMRPAIVVGDSRTGETQKFDGPYYLLRTIAVLDRYGRAIPNFGRAQAPFNVVPVDFVVQTMVAAAGDERATGKTLHLVDPDPLSARELAATLSREYAGREPWGRMPASLLETTLRLAFVRRMFAGTPRESVRYLNHPVRFDTRGADDLLARHGLRCPRFVDYAPAIVRFFRDHQDDPRFLPAPG